MPSRQPPTPFSVLHLCVALEVGGLEKVVLDLVRGQRRRHPQWQVQIGCLSHPGPWGVDDGQPAWIGHPQVANRFLDLGLLGDLVRQVRTSQANLIHSHNPVPHRYAFFASLATGLPLVHTRHGRNYPGRKIAVWLNRLYAWRSACVVPVSKNAMEVALGVEKLPTSKVRLIPNGIDTDLFRPPGGLFAKTEARQKLGVPKDAFLIGSVGRLSPEKDYELLLAAFAELKRSWPAAHLAIVGEGPCRTALAGQVETFGLQGSVSLPGSTNDTRQWLLAFDLFTLTSITEGTSISLLEASACGLPAVVSKVGGNEEIVIDKTSGIVVHNRLPTPFAQAFAWLAANPESAQAMGAAARAHVQSHYSMQTTLDAYDQVYNDVMRKIGKRST